MSVYNQSKTMLLLLRVHQVLSIKIGPKHLICKGGGLVIRLGLVVVGGTITSSDDDDVLFDKFTDTQAGTRWKFG